MKNVKKNLRKVDGLNNYVLYDVRVLKGFCDFYLAKPYYDDDVLPPLQLIVLQFIFLSLDFDQGDRNKHVLGRTSCTNVDAFHSGKYLLLLSLSNQIKLLLSCSKTPPIITLNLATYFASFLSFL